MSENGAVFLVQVFTLFSLLAATVAVVGWCCGWSIAAGKDVAKQRQSQARGFEVMFKAEDEEKPE